MVPSVADYVDADGEEGFFNFNTGSMAAKGTMPGKAAIKRVVIAGRSSHYCPKCQK